MPEVRAFGAAPFVCAGFAEFDHGEVSGDEKTGRATRPRTPLCPDHVKKARS